MHAHLSTFLSILLFADVGGVSELIERWWLQLVEEECRNQCVPLQPYEMPRLKHVKKIVKIWTLLIIFILNNFNEQWFRMTSMSNVRNRLLCEIVWVKCPFCWLRNEKTRMFNFTFLYLPLFYNLCTYIYFRWIRQHIVVVHQSCILQQRWWFIEGPNDAVNELLTVQRVLLTGHYLQ